MAPPAWRDPLVAAVLAIVVVAGAATAPPGERAMDFAGYAVLVISAAATAVVTRWPIPVLIVTSVGMLAYAAPGYPGIGPLLPQLFAIYTVVRAGHRLIAGVAIAVTVVGGLGTQVFSPETTQRWTLLVGWLLAAVVAGELVRKNQAYLEQVEHRAEEAERTREETARRRADEERLRIARELHDSLTHSISIIKVQAGVAIHLTRKRDEPVPEALLAIQEASGDAMRELRSTLELLRDDDLGSGLALVERLVDGARRAGLPVRMDVDGEPCVLPTPVDRAAYRIIQEALTNITRHAGPEVTASVKLSYDKDQLTVRVEDDGHGPQENGTAPGVGLTGMQERVAALGGTLHTGPGDEGGFSVHARLPLALHVEPA
jgi:signal transduction histidine kinase